MKKQIKITNKKEFDLLFEKYYINDYLIDYDLIVNDYITNEQAQLIYDNKVQNISILTNYEDVIYLLANFDIDVDKEELLIQALYYNTALLYFYNYTDYFKNIDNNLLLSKLNKNYLIKEDSLILCYNTNIITSHTTIIILKNIIKQTEKQTKRHKKIEQYIADIKKINREKKIKRLNEKRKK